MQKLCECGCGHPAPIAQRTTKRYKRGEVMRYIGGHWLRKKRGSAHWNYQGNRYMHQGYIMLRIGADHPDAAYAGGRVLEHRLVVMKHLGRRLETWEHVHHIDGDKTNNDIENLELMDARDHSRLHSEDNFAFV